MMCKFSVDHKTREAVVGDNLVIRTVRTTHEHKKTYGVFACADGKAKGCLTCVKDNTVLTLSSIPSDLQEVYRIRPQETVYMIDNGDRQRDMIFFPLANALVPLIVLAHKGIQVFVGEKHSTDQAVADIIADANKAAEENGGIDTRQPELADA